MKKREDVVTVGVFFAIVSLILFMICKISIDVTNNIETSNLTVTVEAVN